MSSFSSLNTTFRFPRQLQRLVDEIRSTRQVIEAELENMCQEVEQDQAAYRATQVSHGVHHECIEDQ